MKALLFPEPWKIELIEVDIPKPGPNEVLAEMVSVGICGSDVGIFEGGHWIVAHEPGGHGPQCHSQPEFPDGGRPHADLAFYRTLRGGYI